MATISELETELEIVTKERDDLQTELTGMQALIVEDEATQETIKNHIAALAEQIEKATQRRAAIGTMPMRESEKSALKSYYQNIIDGLETTKANIELKLTTEA